MYKALNIKLSTLMLLMGFGLLIQGLQAYNGSWYVTDGTTVVGKKHLAQAQKKPTKLFIAKGLEVSGASHFSQKPLQKNTSVFFKPNTKISNWKQVYSPSKTYQSTARIAVVPKPNKATSETPTPQKASKNPHKNKPAATFKPHLPSDEPQHHNVVTATASLSYNKHNTLKKLKTNLAHCKVLKRIEQLSGLQLKTHNQNRARQPQWRSHHTNRPPPSLA